MAGCVQRGRTSAEDAKFSHFCEVIDHLRNCNPHTAFARWVGAALARLPVVTSVAPSRNSIVA
jgi:hypothetical protein